MVTEAEAERILKMRCCCREDGRRGHEPRNACRFYKLKKARECILLRVSRSNNAFLTRKFYPTEPCDLQIYEIII